MKENVRMQNLKARVLKIKKKESSPSTQTICFKEKYNIEKYYK